MFLIRKFWCVPNTIHNRYSNLLHIYDFPDVATKFIIEDNSCR